MSVVTAPGVQTPDPLVEPDPVLMRAAEIVRERWCQDEFGYEGGSRCASGAISEAAGPVDYSLYWNARERFKDSLGGAIVEFWNDVPGRTADEVADAMERAAYGL